MSIFSETSYFPVLLATFSESHMGYDYFISAIPHTINLEMY